VWRWVLIPGEATLGELHEVLQIAMRWTNSHLFAVDGIRYGVPDPDPDWATRRWSTSSECHSAGTAPPRRATSPPSTTTSPPDCSRRPLDASCRTCSRRPPAPRKRGRPHRRHPGAGGPGRGGGAGAVLTAASPPTSGGRSSGTPPSTTSASRTSSPTPCMPISATTSALTRTKDRKMSVGSGRYSSGRPCALTNGAPGPLPGGRRRAPHTRPVHRPAGAPLPARRCRSSGPRRHWRSWRRSARWSGPRCTRPPIGTDGAQNPLRATSPNFA